MRQLVVAMMPGILLLAAFYYVMKFGGEFVLSGLR